MAYVDKSFYDEVLCGAEIPDDEFRRLAEIASDIVYNACNQKPEAEDLVDETFKRAVCYQVELLYQQGGADAIVGYSEASQTGGSESLGDYSVSAGTTAQEAVKTLGGVPVSTMSLMLLRRLGLMSKWAYAWKYRGKP